MTANPNIRQISDQQIAEHTEAWIDAYLDGELSEPAASRLEAHLERSPECLALLESRQELSTLLRAAPLPDEFKPVERFAAEVRLQLKARPVRRRGLGWGWYAFPLALLLALAFFQAALLLNAMLGLVPAIQAPLSEPGLAEALSGLLEMPVTLELLAIRLPSLYLPDWGWLSGALALGGIGLLYSAWLAGWLAHARSRRGQAQTTRM
jgi:anti-sigma factor RsiW